MLRVEVDVAREQGGLQEDAQKLLDDPAGEVVYGIGQAVDVLLQHAGGHELHRDQEKEDGDGQVDEVHRPDLFILAQFAGPGRAGWAR